MGKNAPHCILEFKLYTEKWQADRLSHMFDCFERMYNIMIRYAIKQLAALKNDKEYKSLLESYSKLLKKSDLSIIGNKIPKFQFSFHNLSTTSSQ